MGSSLCRSFYVHNASCMLHGFILSLFHQQNIPRFPICHQRLNSGWNPIAIHLPSRIPTKPPWLWDPRTSNEDDSESPGFGQGYLADTEALLHGSDWLSTSIDLLVNVVDIGGLWLRFFILWFLVAFTDVTLLISVWWWIRRRIRFVLSSAGAEVLYRS